MVPFFEWIADYYRHPIGMVIHGFLPGERHKSASLTRKGKTLLRAGCLILKRGAYCTGSTKTPKKTSLAHEEDLPASGKRVDSGGRPS
jgi:hypothetical protein